MPHLRCNPVHISSFANTSSVAIQFEAIEHVKHFSMISKIVFKLTFLHDKVLQFYQEFDLFQTESITTL